MIRKMFMMFSIIIASLLATNCTKDSPLTDSDVSFNVNYVLDGGGFKSSMVVTPECSSLPASYVKITINDFEKTIPVFYVNGVPWTSSIKLKAGTYTINEFVVYNDNNTPVLTDDIILSAVPHSNTEFAKYVTTPLNFLFTIVDGKKTEIKLDVVCYKPEVSEYFGFVYFNINPIVIRELSFFGDFCIKEKQDYTGSLYNQQTNWVVGTGFIDAPAIAKVEVWKNNVLVETFGNTSQGEKFKVKYADDLKKTGEAFEIKLFILVKQGTAFNYVMFKSWTFNDEFTNIPGIDKLIDFVLGNCYDPTSPPDLILAPWMNLPATATYTITAQPSLLGGYVDATLSNISTGFDFTNGVYGSYCADHNTTIYINQPYNMDVYSSLRPELLPLFAQGLQTNKWNKINWLFNNLDRYPGYNWYDVQGCIWLYDNPVWTGGAQSGMPALTPMMSLMKADADTYGVNFSPLPGGWAAIIFVPAGTSHDATSASIQTMFIKIDP